MARDESLLEHASDPSVVDGAPARDQKKKPDMVQRILEARQQAIEQTATLETIRGLNPPAPAAPPAPVTPGFQLTGTLDLGAALTKTQELTKDLLEKQNSMTEAARTEALASLRSELGEIKKALADPKQPKSDMQTYREVKDLMEEMRGELGLTADVRASAGDLSAQIKLKELDLDLEDRRMKWQEEKEERQRRHEWDMEKWKADREEDRRRWEAEMAERRAENARASGQRQEAMGHVGDLLQAWTGSLDGQMAEGAGTGAGPQAKSFACQQCNAAVPMAAEGEKASCPSCGAVYQIEADER